MLLGVAVVLYTATMSGLPAPGCCDAAGRGLAQAFSLILGLTLWLVLALVMLVAVVKGEMPGWAKFAVLALVPAAAAATFYTMDVYERIEGWAVAVAFLLPPVVALYAAWARFTLVHAVLRPTPTSIAFAVIAVLLIVAAVPLASRDAANWPARLAENKAAGEPLAAQRERDFEQAKAEAAERLRRFTPETSLSDYLEYLSIGSYEAPQEVLDGARAARSKQSDAVALLREGAIGRLQDLWRLDLVATPALCEAYGDAVRAEAAAFPDLDYYIFLPQLERQVPNMRWLADRHCEIAGALGDVERKARGFTAFPNSAGLKAFADELAALRRTP